VSLNRLLVLMIACSGGPSDAELYAEALQASSGEASIELCRSIEERSLSEECISGSVRLYPGSAAACDGIEDPRWAGECWFSVAESQAPDRWTALESCAKAGPYLHECLYHLWTAELSQLLERSPSIELAMASGIEIVDFWSGAEHLVEDPGTQLWQDFWFFAIRHHGPADLGWCEHMDPSLQTPCQDGLRAGVQRSLVDFLEDPGTPESEADRACRSAGFSEDLLERICLDQADLREAARSAAGLACALAKGEPIRRWNPVFREQGP
jgi:hypothetical protein